MDVNYYLILNSPKTIPNQNAQGKKQNPYLSFSCTNFSSSAPLIGEMMLGTVPLVLDGITTKFHHLPETRQILISKLFCIVHKQRVSNYDEEDDNDDKRKGIEFCAVCCG